MISGSRGISKGRFSHTPIAEIKTRLLNQALFHVILFEPEIPPNTGNIIRLCANTGAQLHLIHPLGFDLNHKKLRRAGLDYGEWASIQEHPSYQEFLESVNLSRIFALSTRGCCCYSEQSFQAGDGFLFGPETRGLPEQILNRLPAENRLFLPMLPNSRSLNLSNSTAVVLYEAWRQLRFKMAKTPRNALNGRLI